MTITIINNILCKDPCTRQISIDSILLTSYFLHASIVTITVFLLLMQRSSHETDLHTLHTITLGKLSVSFYGDFDGGG